MGTAAAFLACYCPLRFSDPGKPSDPGISSEFLPAQPGIQQGASRRSHVLMYVDPGDALIPHSHTATSCSGKPPRDTQRAARQGPGQYRRLTYAHEDAAVVTRERGPRSHSFLRPRTVQRHPDTTGGTPREYAPSAPPAATATTGRPRARTSRQARLRREGTQLSSATAGPRRGP